MRSVIQNPLNVVILWWSTWGILSIFSLTDLYIPSNKTYLILSLFIGSLALGGVLGRRVNVKGLIQEDDIDRLVEKKLSVIFKITSYLFFIILSCLVIKSIILLAANETPSAYKFTAFSTPAKIGTLFNNRLLENLYFLISSPCLFFLALYGLVEFWKKNHFQKLAVAFVLNGMDAFMRLGRVNLYMMIVLFFIIVLISNRKVISFLKTQKKYIALIAIALACIVYIGSQREYSASQQIKLFVVDYHTVGFSLFDHELMDKSSPLNTQTTYGRLSLGGLETIATIFIRQFNHNYYSPALANSIRMTNNIVVGIENPPTMIFNGVKMYNSFYTLLYTFYSDGGFFGVIIGGLVFGFLLEFFNRRFLKAQRTLDAFYLVLIISVAILSIFISQLEIMRTWIILMFLFYLSFKTKKADKSAIQ
jgi:oligosaccharide repeat unit polymerase